MIERNRCIRCSKEYVVIDGRLDIYICRECQRIRPHRLDKVIPQLCGIISALGQSLDANFVELNIDDLNLRIQRKN